MASTLRLDQLLELIKRVITPPLFRVLAPPYHFALALLAAFWYGFPSRKLKVIGVTGSKGKSTAVFMIARIFETADIPVAAIGSLGVRLAGTDFKNQWGNT